ncbi:DUF1731 domain-containing protein [Propionibacteriaceae bacterium Y1700]|uniref:DUF1731 domain-containing protein n=1 Tax=Microlunatus sp. Y1700 TaxID=3418487 RepID=UPI003DA7246B
MGRRLAAGGDRRRAEPVRNAELMRMLRHHWAAKGFGLPTPAPLLKVGAVGLRTDPALALTGRHCTSEVLDDVGFAFRYPKLPEALEQIAS